jgi:hypothetical protein
MNNERPNHPPPGRPPVPHLDRPQLGMEAPSSEALHAQDHWRVNLGEDWELVFWSREFGCTVDELKKAVEAVGPTAGTVRAYLASQRQQPRS